MKDIEIKIQPNCEHSAVAQWITSENEQLFLDAAAFCQCSTDFLAKIIHEIYNCNKNGLAYLAIDRTAKTRVRVWDNRILVLSKIRDNNCKDFREVFLDGITIQLSGEGKAPMLSAR